jgi:hypothetical protein
LEICRSSRRDTFSQAANYGVGGVESRQQERKMAKAQRRGNREARKPKVVKAPVAAPESPFAVKGASVATSPPKRKG